MLRNKLFSPKISLFLLLTIHLSTIFLIPISPSLAEIAPIPSPSDAPVEHESQGTVITVNTINPEGLTTPSLWWEKQNSQNKLLDKWITYPANDKEPARVDLIVNQQIWSLLDYIERYDFVNRLGNSARQESHNLRVLNDQNNLLATYTCNFVTTPASCRIQINSQNRLGLLRSF
ncbi:hypothetical protein VB620_04010 [Nodularia harveyana UHCC-0300]|uniref:Uncharacterized protein n=1 Tax=Nodularia harveyana UHCC-0300 TaxID=2974287 RepID=A0ABU5UC20_9CYAN|nr:hypothetical protein [Nodularia harveyana]MEA5580506.1 hypothetical protein [Nodularia harveyana UHCC-0300]